MRVAFLGNAAWSVPSLAALAASSHELVVVMTSEPKPAGRGNRLRPTPVAEAARSIGLPLVEVVTVRADPGVRALALSRPDVLAVVAYGEILPPRVLDLPMVGPVNLHFSLLPRLRGAAPVQRAIMQGLPETGVTTIRMDPGMDTGPILMQAEEAVLPADDAGSLGARLASMGGRLLMDTLDRMEAGSLVERPQDDGLATYAPKLGPEERALDWSAPAEAIVRRVRALSPEPGARTTFRGKVLKVFVADAPAGSLAAPDEDPGSRAPGTIQVTEDGGLGVWAPGRLVVLRAVALEGRGRMSGSDFVRGHRPDRGERLR